MSLLSSLETTEEIVEQGDSVGGKFEPVPSALYQLTIKSAYTTLSKNEAMGLVFEAVTAKGDTIRETFWMTSGKQKGKLTYYTAKNGDKVYLPGFQQANALCLLTCGQEVSKMATEEKIVDIYDYAAKDNIPTKVDMLVDLIDKPIHAGILRVIQDKTIRDEATGKYVPTGELRIVNEFDKFFRAKDNMTITEIKANIPTAEFYIKWNEKWRDKDKDRTTKTATNAPVKATNTAPVANPFA